MVSAVPLRKSRRVMEDMGKTYHGKPRPRPKPMRTTPVAPGGPPVVRQMDQPALMCRALIERSTVIARTAVRTSRHATMMNTAFQLPVICLR